MNTFIKFDSKKITTGNRKVTFHGEGTLIPLTIFTGTIIMSFYKSMNLFYRDLKVGSLRDATKAPAAAANASRLFKNNQFCADCLFIAGF